jgi:predicted PurR-regulated permease PerM
MSMNMGRGLNWAVLIAASCGVLYLCLSILRPFAGAIAWSVVLAIVCYPLDRRLLRKTGRVTLSAFLTSTVAVFALLIPLVVIGGIAATQSVVLGHSLRTALQSPDRSLGRISAGLASVTAGYGIDQHTISLWIHQHRAAWMQNVGQYTLSLAGRVLEATAASVLVFVLVFLFLRDAGRILDDIPSFLPFERQRSELLLHRITDVVHASVYGVVIIALIDGALYGVTFWLLRVPWAALWGMLTVLASVFPIVGAFTVWGPVALYLVIKGSWVSAFTVILVAGVLSAVDHVLRPRLVGGRVGLSKLAMFFALFGGVAAFGVLGVVLGPVAFATLAALVDTLREPAPPALSRHDSR